MERQTRKSCDMIYIKETYQRIFNKKHLSRSNGIKDTEETKSAQGNQNRLPEMVTFKRKLEGEHNAEWIKVENAWQEVPGRGINKCKSRR